MQQKIAMPKTNAITGANSTKRSHLSNDAVLVDCVLLAEFVVKLEAEILVVVDLSVRVVVGAVSLKVLKAR